MLSIYVGKGTLFMIFEPCQVYPLLWENPPHHQFQRFEIRMVNKPVVLREVVGDGWKMEEVAQHQPQVGEPQLS